MPFPLAYFISYTGYGQRLHGDPRVTIDNRWTELGDPIINPNPNLLAFETSKLVNAPFSITPGARRIIRETIERHCEVRLWTLRALNVRVTHVHSVVTCPCPPERALNEFKAWCTRKLRAAKLVTSDQRIWTHHGSTQYLWDAKSVADSVHYVLNEQGPALPEA